MNSTNNRIKVMIDNVSFDRKPVPADTKKIVPRLGKDSSIKEATMQELAQTLIDGYSIKPAICGTKQDEWREQQIFAVDVDDGMTIEAAISKCEEIGMLPAFIYTTFSHMIKGIRFRIVFVLNEIITDFDKGLKIQNTLNGLFNADQQCKNLNRVYYGGRDVVYEGYDNVINVDVLLKRFGDVEGVKGVQDIININNTTSILYPKTQKSNTTNYNVQAIRDQNAEYLKSVLEAPKEPIIFETQQQFLDYIFKIDLSKLLGLEYSNSFSCVFHNDSNPSASIFTDTDTGNYLYKCHSNKCGVAYNILGVVEVLGRFKSRPKAYRFIREIFNLEIMDTDWQREQKDILLENLKAIHSGEFRDSCEQTYKNTKGIIRYLEQMHLIALDNVYNEKFTDCDGNVSFFASGGYIADKIGLSKNSLGKVTRNISALSYHSLINKLDDSQINEDLLSKSQHHSAKEKNGSMRKRVGYFSIPSYTHEKYQEIEGQGAKWKENGYTMKGISREMFYRAEGLDVANRIYPQFEKITKNVDGEFVVVDRRTSKESDDRTLEISKVIIGEIENKGYVTESEVIEQLRWDYGKGFIHKQLKRSLKEILDAYGLVRIRANKDIKERLRIESNGYPLVIVKE